MGAEGRRRTELRKSRMGAVRTSRLSSESAVETVARKETVNWACRQPSEKMYGTISSAEI